MSVATRLAGFLAVLAMVFGAAVAVGRAVSPLESAAHADQGGMTGGGHAGMITEAEAPTAEAGSATASPKGLTVSQDGFTFRLHTTTAPPGAKVPIAFTIEGPDGNPVTAYDVEHDRKLHLIAVRRDLTGFQHVHPAMSPDGTWRTSLTLSPGQWRLFADFTDEGGAALTLGSDLAVREVYRPATLEDSRTATVEDYVVTLGGDLDAGEEARLTLTVTRGGKPVTDLQPYLGAFGHLVALRAGDLAYLHVHPEGPPGDGVTQPGPDIVFSAAVPSPGRYHLYLDFKHEDVVRTAAFAVPARQQPQPQPQPQPQGGNQ